MRLPLRAAGLIGALLALLVLSGCSSLGSTNDGGYIAGDGSILQFDPEDREDPVELSGESLQGEPVDLADHRGKVVVVNLWWSACGPCRTEMPMLVEAAEELEDDAAFLGINIRDSSAANGLAFERAMGVAYPSVYDTSGRSLLAFHGRINPRSIPTTAILDREGRVAAVVSGPIPSKLTLTELVEEIAADDG